MIILFLYIIAILIRPQDWVSFLVGLPVNLVLIIVGLFYGLLRKNNNIRKAISSYPFILMSIYILIIVLSMVANETSVSRIADFSEKWIQRYLLFFIIILIIDDSKRLINTIWFFIINITIIGIQAIQQGLTGIGWNNLRPHPSYKEIRVIWLGDWDGPNVYALILGMAVPMILVAFFNYKSFKIKFLCILIFNILIIAIFYTNSRGAIVAMGVVLTIYLLNRYSKNIKNTIIISIVLVLIGLSITALLPSRMSNVSSDEASAHERTWVWETGMRLLRENPFLGVGKGNFASRNSLGLIAHNNYVQTFAETGIIGYFIWISLLWFITCRIWIISKYTKDKNLFKSIRMMVFSLIFFCVCTFFVTMENDALYLIIGMMTAAYLIGEEELGTCIQLKYTKKDLIIIIAIMMMIYSCIWLVAVKHII